MHACTCVYVYVYYMHVRGTLECHKRASDPQQPWLQVAWKLNSSPLEELQRLKPLPSPKMSLQKDLQALKNGANERRIFQLPNKDWKSLQNFQGSGSVTVEIVMDIWQSGSLSPHFPFQPNKSLQETSPSLSYSSWVIINRESLGLRAPQELKVYP